MALLRGILLVSILAVSVGILLNFECVAPYLDSIFNMLPEPLRSLLTSGHVFTKEELSRYNGSENSLGLYVGIMGDVYDVEEGRRHYGPGGDYNVFAGRDGSKSFITGEFERDFGVDDVGDLTDAQLLDLKSWKEFYDKDYKYMGKVQGYFFDEKGEETEAYKEVKRKIVRGEKEKQLQRKDEEMFPPCNSEWSQDKGSRVWCSNKSGGINRDWVGVPRFYHRTGSSTVRCACVRTSGPPSDNPDSDSNRGDLDNPNLKEHEGCDPLSESCDILP